MAIKLLLDAKMFDSMLKHQVTAVAAFCLVSEGHCIGMQVDVAAGRLRDSVVSTAESDLTSQAYWLSATLALGAFLKVCSPSYSRLLDHHVHVLAFCLQITPTAMHAVQCTAA